MFKGFYCTKIVSKELSVTFLCAFFKLSILIRGFDWAISGTVSFLDPEHSSSCIRNFAVSHCHCVQTLIIWGRANSYTSLSTLLKLPIRTGHFFFFFFHESISHKNAYIYIYIFIYNHPEIFWVFFTYLCSLPHLPSTQNKFSFSDRCKNTVL